MWSAGRRTHVSPTHHPEGHVAHRHPGGLPPCRSGQQSRRGSRVCERSCFQPLLYVPPPKSLSKDYPHSDAIKGLVAWRTDPANASGCYLWIKGECGSPIRAATQVTTPATSGTKASGSNATLVPLISNASAAPESAGVASGLPHISHTPDWLRDSGTSSSWRNHQLQQYSHTP